MAGKTIVVFGATGRQGRGVVNALLDQGGYTVRAISRDTGSDQARRLAARGVEVVAADLNVADTLASALSGAYGVFLVTNFWDPATGTSEYDQVRNVVDAAKSAGVSHVVWSTLPNVHEISGGRYEVSHFTNKARANSMIASAGFPYYSFVEAPFFFQNFLAQMAPQPTGNGNQKVLAVPMDIASKNIHAGDIHELGKLVRQVFDHPETAGQGQVLSLCADAYSWQGFADALNALGHNVVVNQVPGNVYDTFYPGADEVREMMSYFEEFSYFGPEADAKRARADALVEGKLTNFAEWVKVNMPA
ncbi:NmrA/HSCARG family protein [Burkholderia sp. BCC0405]|uniref:NmrA/HSCARG family protein n=1 Tax=Burkholderia sp. BCC0405 TaxID=2676298 RepID=UPI0015897C61|nr:NmrA/HSCARG family protein [Burkholderia sp. BCC0405]